MYDKELNEIALEVFIEENKIKVLERAINNNNIEAIRDLYENYINKSEIRYIINNIKLTDSTTKETLLYFTKILDLQFNTYLACKVAEESPLLLAFVLDLMNEEELKKDFFKIKYASSFKNINIFIESKCGYLLSKKDITISQNAYNKDSKELVYIVDNSFELSNDVSNLTTDNLKVLIDKGVLNDTKRKNILNSSNEVLKNTLLDLEIKDN